MVAVLIFVIWIQLKYEHRAGQPGGSFVCFREISDLLGFEEFPHETICPLSTQTRKAVCRPWFSALWFEMFPGKALNTPKNPKACI